MPWMVSFAGSTTTFMVCPCACLAYSSDAEDATQEILIKIITHLSTFRGESSFRTWSFRIAVNHLLSIKKSRAKEMNISFDMWEQLGNREDPSFDSASLPDAEKMLLDRRGAYRMHAGHAPVSRWENTYCLYTRGTI